MGRLLEAMGGFAVKQGSELAIVDGAEKEEIIEGVDGVRAFTRGKGVILSCKR